jgi:hypothetical protein
MSDISYEDRWRQHLDISFDEALKTLLNKGLRWLPWIGKDYRKSIGKILIVGESHYTNEQDLNRVVEKKAECHGNVLLTREIVAEYPLEGYEAGWLNNAGRRNNPTFDNLHRVLLKDDLLQAIDIKRRGRLWEQFAFYNFIQNAMDYGNNRRERPSTDDFLRGWRLFVQLIEVLHPKVCVFIGVQASNFFNEAMCKLEIQHTPITWGDPINRVYARVGGSVTVAGETTKLLFMRHTSQYFRWENWYDYLETMMPENMANLSRVVLTEAFQEKATA